MPSDAAEEDRGQPRVEDFLSEPTRDIDDWRWLWETDQRFPARTHRGALGRVALAFKRLLRPLVKIPTNDLWDRQRTFNLILLEYCQSYLNELAHQALRVSEVEERSEERDRDLDVGLQDLKGDLEARLFDHEHRVSHLEAFLSEGLEELMRYSDALYSRVDQKFDKYRRQARDLSSQMAAGLAAIESEGVQVLQEVVDEADYRELERRHRGTEEELRQRAAPYVETLTGREHVLDLGCGRGEVLELLVENGIGCRGIDASEDMVRLCGERGVSAERADILPYLAKIDEGSLDGIVSFHVIEHLEATTINRLLRLAWRALRKGGVVILETPNPLSIMVAASTFWRDPTHRRPIHPDALALGFELAGFEAIETRHLHPFPDRVRLPEIELADLDDAGKRLGHRINELRDRIDQSLYGYQDYAVIAYKP